MTLEKKFEDFCGTLDIHSEESEKWQKRCTRIVNKLNEKYYTENNNKDVLLIVGSVGRGTAINGVSDYDCIYQLPEEIYKKFDNYESNGQSALLQEVKEEIKKTYSTTTIKGDGQVVVVEFKDGCIEIVPAFKLKDDSFKYPDANDGGSWKLTKPLIEQNAACEIAELTQDHYLNFCKLVRAWKNNEGFKFNGLLIDTLVYNYLIEIKQSITFEDYHTMLQELFIRLSEENENRSFWYALGSNQKIYNSDKSKFIKNAKKIVKKFNDVSSETGDIEKVYIDIFGKKFDNETKQTTKSEEFISSSYHIDIQYDILLDCTVEQDGFRIRSLRDFIVNKQFLKQNKTLTFTIKNQTIPCDIFNQITWMWKVKNVGSEAKKRNMERGQIEIGGLSKIEHTSFSGDHYVVCYAVKNEVVIASSQISVPIDVTNGVN